jgi:hypothetical protein
MIIRRFSSLAVVRQADWDRQRAENVDRALFTVVDGYDPPKMKEAISWCWREGSAARNRVPADGGRFSLRSVGAFFLLLHHATDWEQSNLEMGSIHLFLLIPFFFRRLSRPLHGSSGREPADGPAPGPRHDFPVGRGPDALRRPRSDHAERESQ